MSLCSPRRSAVALLALFCACAHAQRDPGTTIGGQVPQIGVDSARKNVVAMIYDGRVAYVRIETREAGAAPNQHPVAVEPATLRALLMRVVWPEKKNEPVFSGDQLDEIVAPLAQALARATPEQDVSFAVSGRGALGLLAPRDVTTARVFFAEDRMNLVFGLVHKDWESRYRATAYVIPFEPGKRAAPVDQEAKVAGSYGANNRRVDWVMIDPLAQPPAPAPDLAKPPAVVIPSATPAAPAAPVAPAAAPKATPAESETIARQVTERLKALDKLRDAGVITEQEYQEKRREILKSF